MSDPTSDHEQEQPAAQSPSTPVSDTPRPQPAGAPQFAQLGSVGTTPPAYCLQPQSQPRLSWDQLDLAEKVERLREHLRTDNHLRQEMYRLLLQLTYHRHGEDGKVLVELHGGLVGAAGYDPLA